MVGFIGTRICLTSQDHQSEKYTKTRRKYDRTGEPADFKTDLLKMLANGQTPAYIANALGISGNIIYRWKSMNQVGKKSNHLTGDLTIENQQLRDRVRQLETEREISKKARRAAPLSSFSRAT